MDAPILINRSVYSRNFSQNKSLGYTCNNIREYSKFVHFVCPDTADVELDWPEKSDLDATGTSQLSSGVHIRLANTVFSISNIFDRHKNKFLLDKIKRTCLSVTVKQLKCSSDSITVKFKPHAVKLQKTHTVQNLFAPFWCFCKSLKISFWWSHNATLLKTYQCPRESIEENISVRKVNTKCHCVWLKLLSCWKQTHKHPHLSLSF